MLIAFSVTTLSGTGRAAESVEYEPITPYRPSVSTPAQLPFPGQPDPGDEALEHRPHNG